MTALVRWAARIGFSFSDPSGVREKLALIAPDLYTISNVGDFTPVLDHSTRLLRLKVPAVRGEQLKKLSFYRASVSPDADPTNTQVDKLDCRGKYVGFCSLYV